MALQFAGTADETLLERRRLDGLERSAHSSTSTTYILSSNRSPYSSTTTTMPPSTTTSNLRILPTTSSLSATPTTSHRRFPPPPPSSFLASSMLALSMSTSASASTTTSTSTSLRLLPTTTSTSSTLRVLPTSSSIRSLPSSSSTSSSSSTTTTARTIPPSSSSSPSPHPVPVKAPHQQRNKSKPIASNDQKGKRINEPKERRRRDEYQHCGRATMIVSKIHKDSLRMVSISAQAIFVRAPNHPYTIYHMQITSEYYKQKWVVCKRYSEFYRVRKLLLRRLKTHGKGDCEQCKNLHGKLKKCKFPQRLCLFSSDLEVINKRTLGLGDFLGELCNILADENVAKKLSCKEIVRMHGFVKEYLHFPVDHENHHVLAVRSLEYIDCRPVNIETDSCPICLTDWLDRGEALVQSTCGHFFHETCINEWFKTRFDCPMCRTVAGEFEQRNFMNGSSPISPRS